MKDSVALLAAAALLIVGIGFGVFLVLNVGVEDSAWDRYILVFGAAEAVVFAAVGWLFGKEVHRQEAKDAKVAHGQAQAESTAASMEAAAQAERGRNLAAVVQSAAQSLPSGFVAGTGSAAEQALAHASEVATRLYSPREG